MRLQLLLSAALLAGCGDTTAPPAPSAEPGQDEPTGLVAQSVAIPSDHGTMNLRLKHRRGALGRAARTILLLPSATYSTGPNWDLSYEDASLMDHLAARDWFVFALDLPGYGASPDPPEPGRFGADQAADCIRAALEHIESTHGIESASVLGWSWGAQAAGRFASRSPERVERLVLYGYTYSRRMPADYLPTEPLRPITWDGAQSDFIEGCFDPELAVAYADAVAASDDSVPSGALVDFIERLPLVDPAALTMPVLVISGQYEVEPPPGDEEFAEFFAERRQDLELFAERASAELTIVPGGGHAVHLEHPRHAWRDTVTRFLEQ